MSEKFPARSEVEKRYTWNLEAIYVNREEYEKDSAFLEEKVQKMEEDFKGKIQQFKDPQEFLALMEREHELTEIIVKQSAYPFFSYVTDKSDPKAAAFSMESNQKIGEYQGRLNFIFDELHRLDDDYLKSVAASLKQYEGPIKSLLEAKKHLLSPETEEVLAKLRPLSSSYHTIYESNKCTDMRFEEFEVDGKKYPMSYVLFENVYATHKDARVREKAFASFNKTLRQYKNTIAGVYMSHVAVDVKMAKIRGFKDVFEYLLADQKVSKEMYDRQIDIIMSELSPVMRRFARLQKRVLGLEKMHFADLKALIDPDFSQKVTVEEAKDYIERAMELPGKEYSDMIMRFYEERWIDFPQNEGKESGGFCFDVYGVHPYILLNWSNDLSETFTLAHELGHAGQGLLSAKYGPDGFKDFSMYLVEAPSTFHELLLGESMTKEASDDRFKRFVYSSIIANTYYHNFVTHLHEAAFQREVYRRADAGEALMAEDLDAIFRKVLEDFWGEDVEIEEGAEMTWMRQPHYYMGLYSYTYSASLTISTNMLLRLREEGPKAMDDWFEFLKAGGRYQPLEHAKVAGIDISTPEALRRAISYVETLVEAVEELTP